MEPWTGAERAFAVKAFYKNGDSFVIAHREFWWEFGIHCNHAVPSSHAIKTWVWNFEATSSTIKKKCGSVKTVRTPENIAVVREIIERSPHRSARRHCVSLGLSEASVRWIIQKDLHFYPYKIQVTYAVHECDYVNRVDFCQTFLQLLKTKSLWTTYWWAMKLDFIYPVLLTNKFSIIVLPHTPQNFMRDHFTVPKSQYGARYLHLELSVLTSLKMGIAVAQWLRCCATNRKIAGSILAGVIGIFHWHKILPIALWPWGRLSL